MHRQPTINVPDRSSHLIEVLPAMPNRSDLRARVYRLGEEPRDDLSVCTSADERLALVAELTRELWALAGLQIPMYSRAQMPVAIVHRDIREK